MTTEEFAALAEQYEQQAGFHSFAHMMRRAPVYRELVARGWELVTHVIAMFRREGGSAMWFVVLEEITRHTPLPPEPLVVDGTVVPGWSAMDVRATGEAWVAWWDAREPVGG